MMLYPVDGGLKGVISGVVRGSLANAMLPTNSLGQEL